MADIAISEIDKGLLQMVINIDIEGEPNDVLTVILNGIPYTRTPPKQPQEAMLALAEKWKKEAKERKMAIGNRNPCAKASHWTDAVDNGKILALKRCAKELRQAHPSTPTASKEGEAWIPVKERMPDNSDRVLIYRPHPHFNQKHYYISRWKNGVWAAKGHDFSDIAHWMPLPSSPTPNATTKDGE